MTDPAEVEVPNDDLETSQISRGAGKGKVHGDEICLALPSPSSVAQPGGTGRDERGVVFFPGANVYFVF